MVRQAGFTLLEVLVALAVLGLTLSVYVGGVSGRVQQQQDLETRRLAHWVADNMATELRITRAWPPISASSGQITLAERTWFWHQQVDTTEDQNLRRVEIRVSDQENPQENSRASLTAFLLDPDTMLAD